jgi:two-component system CheB/CheR fusion protein
MTRILLVEDAEDILYLLGLQLEWMGYAVTTATNAKSGLEAASRIHPQIIISDLRMPEIDGFEFIRRVRRVDSLRLVPAIALTGLGSDSEIQQAIDCGFTAHLTKPVEASDLSRLIERLTTRHVQRKAS